MHGSFHRRHKVDAIHHEALAFLHDIGFSVADTSKLGGGYPDADVGACGVNDLLEFKTGTAPFTPAQEKFIAEWRGREVVVLRSMPAVKEWGLRTLHERKRSSQPDQHRALTPVVVDIPKTHVVDGRYRGETPKE
jgi:hypothetical protein